MEGIFSVPAGLRAVGVRSALYYGDFTLQCFKKNPNASIDLLSIPQSGEKNVKTLV